MELDFEAKVKALEAEVAEVMGVVNAAQGRLVELMGTALDEGLWQVWGIHSPAHWLGWQAGMATGRAGAVVKIAQRRHELPTAVAALVAGELSVDAAIEVAKRAPAGYEESITEFAKVSTIAQLRRSLAGYVYDPDTEKAKPKPPADTRSVSMGTDANGWWMKGRLPVDEGSVVEQAIRAARDDLFRQQPAGTGSVTWADGLVAAAEASLTVGEARFPGSDRYQVHLHLDAVPQPAGPGGVLSVHLGSVVPAAIRSRLLCDATLRPTYRVDGVALSVGRKTRAVSRRLRRVVEHRDGGCRIPGCGRTFGLEIHHITHWEHGGATDTNNLCALCWHHHRLHHHGLLAIVGDADGDLEITDRWGRMLHRTGTPTPPRAGTTPQQAAAQAGIEPGTYQHPLGEPLKAWWVTFNPNRPPPPEPPPPEDHDPGDNTGGNRPGQPPRPPVGPIPGSASDPRHGGPHTGSSPPQAA